MPRSRPFGARALAFSVAAAGLVLLFQAFAGGSKTGDPWEPSILSNSNGVIYFQVGGGDAETWIDAIRPDGTDQRLVFPPEPVHYDEIAWSPDGTRIAYRDNLVDHFGIYVANPDGTDAIRLTDGNDGWPSWSPDGTKIAFAGSSDSPDAKPCGPGAEFMCPADIYVMNADGTAVTRLTNDLAPKSQVAWSPDGKRIAFVQVDGDDQDLYVMNSNGSGVARVASGAGTLVHPTWSPDGTKIAFAGLDRNGIGIFVVNPDGTGLTQLFSDPGWVAEYPAWSPDGTKIAFMKWADQPEVAGCDPASTCDAQLYLMNPDGSGLTRLTDVPEGASRPAWQPIPIQGSSSPVASAPVSPRVAQPSTLGPMVRPHPPCTPRAACGSRGTGSREAEDLTDRWSSASTLPPTRWSPGSPWMRPRPGRWAEEESPLAMDRSG